MIASIALMALAQKAPDGPQPRKGSAETSLLGISLYDPGTRVIAKFGSPDQILGITVGTSTSGNGPAGAGDRGGPPSGAGGPGGRSGGGGGGAAGTADFTTPYGNNIIGDPFSGDDSQWRQLDRQRPANPPGASGAGAPGAGPGSTDSPEGGGRGGSRGGGGKGGDAGGGASSGAGTKVTFTRWVYKRKNSKYAFILDKFNRVVQIEAIGLKNSSVRTKRGVTFGSSFGTLIQKYNTPDGYEVNGDNLVVRFLVRDRVAFKLNKIDAKKPHVVTGIVVAAGKI